MKSLFLIPIAGLSLAFAAASTPCELSTAALMKYERQILQATEKFATKDNRKFLDAVSPSLNCVLQIQAKAQGYLQMMANSFLKPLMGGGQVRGVPADKRYALFAREMTRVAEQSSHVLRDSLPAAHLRGAWGMYQGFCGPQNNVYCTDFLPNESLIDGQSPLLGASSMIMLRQAYFALDGPAREDVANRIRRLYERTPTSDVLKRKVINEIYQELFPRLDNPLS